MIYYNIVNNLNLNYVGFYECGNSFEKDMCENEEWMENYYSHTMTKPMTDSPECFPTMVIWTLKHKSLRKDDKYSSIDLPRFIVVFESFDAWDEVAVENLVSLYDLINKYLPLIHAEESKEHCARFEARFDKTMNETRKKDWE